MATLFGMVLVAGGIAILAVARPWRRDDDDDDDDYGDGDVGSPIIPGDETPTAVFHMPKTSRPSPRAPKPSAGPQPKPAAKTSPAPTAYDRTAIGNAPTTRSFDAQAINGHPPNSRSFDTYAINGHPPYEHSLTTHPANGQTGHPADMSSAGRRHRVEVISRARRVPPAPGREEIMLPEWLGPVSGPR